LIAGHERSTSGVEERQIHLLVASLRGSLHQDPP